jgi:hypothetical protein
MIVLLLCLAACAPLSREDDVRTIAHRVHVRHPGFPSDEPKAYTLYQINDEKGFPSEYRMTVDSVICPEQTCQIIAVDMTWDALGRYQRYALPPGGFLEKGLPAEERTAKTGAAASVESVAFTEADYQKLDAILKDAHSLLGQQKLPDVVRLSSKGDVDGITGATPASVRDAVVEGASLTCYHLWHWANGEVAGIAKELTHRQCGEAMLLSFLSSGKPHDALFALEHLRLHGLFSPSAVQAVSGAMRGGDRERIDLGLAYLREALPDQEPFYANVAAVILSGSGAVRAYLLGRLASEPSLPVRFFETLGADLPNWNSYYEIHLFLRLAEKSGYTSPSLIAQASKILENPDFFIARRAHGFLSNQPALDAQTAGLLQAFRDKAAREGRTL